MAVSHESFWIAIAENLQSAPNATVEELVERLKTDNRIQINRDNARAFQTEVKEGGNAYVGVHLHDFDEEKLGKVLKAFWKSLEFTINKGQKLKGIYNDPLPDCTLFQGRQNELKQLTAWLQDEATSIIGIRGEGGIGKSTLAAKVFTDSPGFTGKGWFDLITAPSITKVAEQALQEFGMSPEQMQSIEKKDLPQRLLRKLQSHRYLLALDNLESILTKEGEWFSGYKEFFYKFEKQCRPSVLLLTAREYQPRYYSLLHSKWLLVETGLEPSEGAALLAALEVEGTEEERATVSHKAQGHPLALSLLAGRLREEFREGSRSVKYLDTEPNLFHVKRKCGSEKQISVQEVFKWSFNRLSLDLQNLLTQVSVLRGAFNRKVVATLMQRSVEDEELHDLERRVLLQELPAPDQYKLKLYRLQPRTQDFVAQERDLTEAHERAIGYFRSQHQTNLDTATTQEDAKEYLETFHHQCELKRYQAAAQTIFACNDFLQRRGYVQLLVDRYTYLHTLWRQPTSDQHDDYACLCFNLGIAYDSLGQYNRAIEYQQQSLDIRKDIRDRKGEASCLRNLGNAYTSLRNYGKAIEYQQESLEITKDIGDPHGKANSLGNLGNVYTSLEDYGKAIEFYEKSLYIIRKIDERQEEAKCLGNLGNVCTSLGDYRQAIEYQQESLKITKGIGDRKGEANCLGNLGNVCTSLGDYGKAIEYYKQSRDIRKNIGDPHGEASCLFNLGNVYANQKNYPQAIESYEQSRDIRKNIGDPHGEASCLFNLGNVYANQKNYPQAIESYEQSRAIRETIGDPHGEANCFFKLGNIYIKEKKYPQAIESYKQSLEITEYFRDPHKKASCLFNLGNVYANQKNYPQAIKSYEQSRDIRKNIGDRKGEATCLFNLGNVYIYSKRSIDALQYLQQALTIYEDLQLNHEIEKCKAKIARYNGSIPPL